MHAIRHTLAVFGMLGAVFFAAGPTSAQCTYQWFPGEGLPGLDDWVLAAVVYDVGTGPALYVGGDFSTAGGTPVNHIARWDGATWSPLGSGMNNGVLALTVYNGELIAGGSFSTAGGTAANFIARWDGTIWSPLGSGMNATVRALTEYNGELIAGGQFTTAGGTPANHIARWDSATWSPLGSGVEGQDAIVSALTEYNGELIAGGSFLTAGEQGSAYWARWGPDVPLGDLDGDCTVGVTDLLILLANWGPCTDCDDCPADLDGDCTVGVSDLLILLANWG